MRLSCHEHCGVGTLKAMGQTPVTIEGLLRENEGLRRENAELKEKVEKLTSDLIKLRLLRSSPAFHALPVSENRRLIQSLCPPVAPVSLCLATVSGR